jgi:hypothetical protein
MSASTTATVSSTSVYATAAFWERLWRSSGIQSVGLFIVAYLIYGNQPQIGAPAEALVAFYDGNRTRILIATIFSGLAILNLMWFAAALRTTLADAGQEGWGAAATASGAALGGLFLLLITVGAALAHSIAGAGDHTLTSGLNGFAWAGVVLSSFPRAMLIMAAAFGLWRAKLISNALFAVGDRSGGAHLAGRHHVAERRILGAGRRLFAVRLAHHRPRVGPGRELGPSDPKSCDACWMVMTTLPRWSSTCSSSDDAKP